jgi:hypothetical protein
VRLHLDSGGVAEWLKAAVLKTAVAHATGGSNPSSSAKVRLGEGRVAVEEVRGGMAEEAMPPEAASPEANPASSAKVRLGEGRVAVEEVRGGMAEEAMPPEAASPEANLASSAKLAGARAEERRETAPPTCFYWC